MLHASGQVAFLRNQVVRTGGFAGQKSTSRRMMFQALLAYPFFVLLNTGNTGLIWLAIALGLAIGHGSVYGAQGAFFSELFPARILYSGLSLVQQLGPILSGGLSPLIATALFSEYGTPWTVAIYIVALAILSAVCAIGLKARHA